MSTKETKSKLSEPRTIQQTKHKLHIEFIICDLINILISIQITIGMQLFSIRRDYWCRRYLTKKGCMAYWKFNVRTLVHSPLKIDLLFTKKYIKDT